MINVRKSEDRGKAENIDWLESSHTFSFGTYFNREHMHFGALRVINEDRISPRQGFGAHPHRDMEIITFVMEGALEHKDSLGNGSIIVPGDVQYMSAGTGIVHSEYNPQDKPVHLLQIWIIPPAQNLPAGYQQKNFTRIRKAGELTLLASQGGRGDSIGLYQDVSLYVLDLHKGQTYDLPMAKGRMVWVQMAKGATTLNGLNLNQGDGAAATAETSLSFKATDNAEILIFDLAESDTA